jgi:hypothetical protein
LNRIKRRLVMLQAKKYVDPKDVKEFASVGPFVVIHQGSITVAMDKTKPMDIRQEAFKSLLPEVEHFVEKHPSAKAFFDKWTSEGKEALGL